MFMKLSIIQNICKLKHFIQSCNILLLIHPTKPWQREYLTAQARLWRLRHAPPYQVLHYQKSIIQFIYLQVLIIRSNTSVIPIKRIIQAENLNIDSGNKIEIFGVYLKKSFPVFLVHNKNLKIFDFGFFFDFLF